MRKLITSIIAILIIVSIIGAGADIDLYRPGFKLWGWDINIMGLEVHNGTINGTRFLTSNSTVVTNFNSDMLDGTHLSTLQGINDAQNVSITELQGNDTADRTYVNDTFLKLSGGTMEDSIKNASINGEIVFKSQLNNSKSLGQFNTLDFGGLSYYFYLTNRKWNTSSFLTEYGSYPERKGGQLMMVNAKLQYRTFESNSIATTIRFEFDDSDNRFRINDLSGTGNAYACIDSTGKLYRSATACTS